MQVARAIADTFAPVVDLVYPPRCPGCGDAIAAQNGLCATCWGALDIPGEPACAACQRPLDEAQEHSGVVCASCMEAPPIHDGIAAGTVYNDMSRKLVLAYKHGGRIALAAMLARFISARLPEPDPSRLLVPVPLHRWRLWGRGFNQSALLAKELAKLGHGHVLVGGLLRSRATPSLGGMSAKKRSDILRGAIKVAASAKKQIADAEIILVDDVMTSGATSHACIQALKEAGADSVRIACFARVLKG